MRHVWTIFNVIAGIASIVSFLFAIFNKGEYVTLSFHIFLIAMFLSYISFKIYDLRIIKREKFQNIVTYYRWTIYNERDAKYDAFRVVKSNRPYLPSINLKHVWSGNGKLSVIAHNKLTKWEHSGTNINIKYPVSLYLNEYKAIHYTINTTDTSGRQCPFLKCGGKNRVGMLILEVVLPDKTDMPEAKIYVTEVGKIFHSGQEVDKVQFDSLTKSYHWELFDFPGDCDYWMVWGDEKIIH